MTRKPGPEWGAAQREESAGTTAETAGTTAEAAGAAAPAAGAGNAEPEMLPGFGAEEFNALFGPGWKEGDPRDRVDPPRFARVVLAMKRVKRLKPDKQHGEHNYPYVSKAAVYDHIRECLADCGLHIRARLNKPIEISAER